MSDFFDTYNTRYLDLMIDSLTIIRSFTILSSTSATINPAQIVQLDIKIQELIAMRNECIQIQNKARENIEGVIETVNQQ